MAETPTMTPSDVATEHAAESHAPYLRVWLALAVFTAVEYFYAFIFKELFILLLLGLLIWAAIKAGLVGWFFMHLKFEGPWVYTLIVAAAVLATILVLALVPDVVFKPESDENAEAVWAAPGVERPLARGASALAGCFPRDFGDGLSIPTPRKPANFPS